MGRDSDVQGSAETVDYEAFVLVSSSGQHKRGFKNLQFTGLWETLLEQDSLALLINSLKNLSYWYLTLPVLFLTTLKINPFSRPPLYIALTFELI